ncbi:MAG: rhomboid family intramembrane serine protease [Bacteroidota bacterium]|nr:rhomboid family intramembrane serine protease [Bacteroidota bacterium]
MKNLLLLNTILYIGSLLIPEMLDVLALYYPGSAHFQPYQIITHMFMHGSFFHFLFNMYALWMFGTVVEQQWGPKKFLMYYFICGLGAAALHYGVMAYEFTGFEKDLVAQGYGTDTVRVQMDRLKDLPRVIGASGAIYGLLAAFGFLFPNNMLMLLFPPIPIKAKYFVMILIAIDLYAGISSRQGDNVAHFAHIGGAIAGLIIMLFWRNRGTLYQSS